MGFLKRALGGGGEPAPEWAAPLDADGHRAFMAALDVELRGRGREYRIEDGFVVADLDAPGMGPGTQLGLTNLAQLCAALPRQQWPKAIRDHFDNLVRAARDDAELDQQATDFERVRELLKVRLYGADQLTGIPLDPPLRWELAPGIVAALVYDLPTTVRTVSPTHVAAWPYAHDELVRVGLDNVRRDPVERQTVPLDGGGAIEALTGDHFFVASHALMLGDHVTDADGHGVLVAVPTRHTVLFHAIRDASVVRAVNTLIAVANGMYRQGPGSISSALYWWRGGTFSLLPAEADEKGIRFAPPESFVALLNEVTARQPGS
jgi:hypothetical protein